MGGLRELLDGDDDFLQQLGRLPVGGRQVVFHVLDHVPVRRRGLPRDTERGDTPRAPIIGLKRNGRADVLGPARRGLIGVMSRGIGSFRFLSLRSKGSARRCEAYRHAPALPPSRCLKPSLSLRLELPPPSPTSAQTRSLPPAALSASARSAGAGLISRLYSAVIAFLMRMSRVLRRLPAFVPRRWLRG